MGNTSSDNPELHDFESNYNVVRQEDSPPYGPITLLEHKNNQTLVALREIFTRNSRDFDREIAFYRIRFRIIHPNVVKLIGFTSKHEDHLCTTTYKVLALLEFFENNLEQEVIYKSKNGSPYTEQHLWSLITALIKGLLVLEKHSITHGDVKPNAIFISKNGEYKLLEHNMLGNGKTAYQNRLSSSSKGLCYLSPALMGCLAKSEVKPVHNPYKSDVWSAGLCALQAATLSGNDGLYDWGTGSIDKSKLDSKLFSIKGKYNQKIYDILTDMLQWDEEKRLSFSELATKYSIITTDTIDGNPIVSETKPIPLSESIIKKSNAGFMEAPERVEREIRGSAPITSSGRTIEREVRGNAPSSNTLNVTPITNANLATSTYVPSTTNTSSYNPRSHLQSSAYNLIKPSVDNYKPPVKLTDPDPHPINQPYATNISQPEVKTEISNNSPEKLNRDVIEEKKTVDDDHVVDYKWRPTQSPINEQKQIPIVDPYAPNPEVERIKREFYEKMATESRAYELNRTPVRTQSPIRSLETRSPTRSPSRVTWADQPTTTVNYNRDVQRRVDAVIDGIRERARSRSRSPSPVRQTSGYVTETYIDGSVYEGEKRGDLRHGKGRFNYADGGMYSGDWVLGSIEGYGVLYYAGGKKAYEGMWRSDKFNGKGVLYNERPNSLYGDFDYFDFDRLGKGWTKYEGDFVDDNKHGNGMLYLANGDVFSGQFKGDVINGVGTFYSASGKTVRGEWVNNRFSRSI